MAKRKPKQPSPPAATEPGEAEALLAMAPASARLALEDPAWFLRELDRVDAERHLIDFMRLMWPVVEPSQPFVRGWALDAMAEHLEAVTAKQIVRLIISVPPGFAKSLMSGVFWPAWEWGPRNMPSMRHLGASYVSSLITRDNMRCRRLLESPEYQSRWGDRFQMTGDQDAKMKFENDKTGWMQGAVIGGATGERADRCRLDDPHSVKGAESTAKREATLAWHAEAWSSRVNNEDSARIIIGQRTHERDITGMVLAADLGYVHLCIPMDWRGDHPYISYNWRPTSIGWVDPRTEPGDLAFPERFTPKGVEQLKREMRSWGGTYAESAQLDQVPVPRGGGMFQRDKFQIVAPVDVPVGGNVVRGWDLAASTTTGSAFTAGVKMRRVNGKLYVEDVVREQASPHRVEEMIVACAKGDGGDCIQDLPQDPGQAGKSQIAYFAKQLHGHRFQFSPESGSKEDRAMPLASQVGAGNVFLVKAPWNDAYVVEAASFPVGKFKDQVDASTRTYAALLEFPDGAVAIGEAPEIIGVENGHGYTMDGSY